MTRDRAAAAARDEALPDQESAAEGGGLVTAFFETLYDLRPVDATFVGMHNHDHRLPDWSPQGHDVALARWRDTGNALRAAGHDRLTDAELAARDWPRIDGALALSHVDLTLVELESRQFSRGNPSLAIGEAAFSVIGLMTRAFAPAEQRASYLLPRLGAIPRFLSSALGTLSQEPIPSAWTRKALTEAAATERLLLEGLPLWCAAMALSPDRSAALVNAAQQAAGAVAGFSAALAALPQDAPAARPAGELLLATCLTRGHWIERSIEDLLAEVREALPLHQSMLRERVREAGAATLPEVQARLAARHPTADRFLAAFMECWEGCRQHAAANDLVTWPNAPIRYVPIPTWTRMAAPSLYYLFYRSPAPFDHYDVYDYVVTPIDGLDEAAIERVLAGWNHGAIKLNHVVHHGALGHHVQNWFAARAPSRIGRMAAADCASRIAMLQGGTMAEGWACYATDLMEEVGFLTPDERVSEQHTRVRMLVRALVDLEFHTGRCSFDDSVHRYVEEVGMGVDMARAEAVKNSMFPGTALMYWFGTQEVHAARADARQRGDTSVSLRAFHDRFLSHGAIPVTVIRKLLALGVT